jgi:hypothetical protein
MFSAMQVPPASRKHTRQEESLTFMRHKNGTLIAQLPVITFHTIFRLSRRWRLSPCIPTEDALFWRKKGRWETCWNQFCLRVHGSQLAAHQGKIFNESNAERSIGVIFLLLLK